MSRTWCRWWPCCIKSCNDFHLIRDSKQQGTFHSARWQHQTCLYRRWSVTTCLLFSPDLTSHTANAVAAHLVQVAKAPSNNKFERHIRDQRRQFLHHAPDKSSLPAFTTSDIDCALKLVKSGTAPGDDNIHPEFLTHLGSRACTWMSHFFTRDNRGKSDPQNLEKCKGDCYREARQRSKARSKLSPNLSA